MNTPITSTEIEAVIKKKKISQKTKALHQMASQENSMKTFREELMPILLKLSKICRERNTSKLILQGHHHPDTKTRQRQHAKRKLQANIIDEYTCKNPQHNFS